MSATLEKCKACVDQTFIEWDKCNKISKAERRNTAEYIVWGIVHLALYLLDFDEYNTFKRYIYEQHGYDAGGVADGQISIYDMAGGDE